MQRDTNRKLFIHVHVNKSIQYHWPSIISNFNNSHPKLRRHQRPQPTLHKENYHWSSNFAISVMANSLNLNSAHVYILRNLL